MPNNTFSDFSQLPKTLFKNMPEKAESKPAPPKSGKDGADALAYFARSATGKKPDGTTPPDAAHDPPERGNDALKAANAALETEREKLRRDLAAQTAALAAAQREIARLQGMCGQLKGELKKSMSATAETPSAEKDKTAGSARTECERTMKGLLANPKGLDETFPGEMREMVVSALSAACESARQSGRERRAAVLSTVLAANPATGELARRREKLKQIMKDGGYCTDPRELEALGVKLVSGRNHWKLQCGGVRVPIAKTPSDFRASLNIATDLANRFF